MGILHDVKESVAQTAQDVVGKDTLQNFQQTTQQVAGTVNQVTNVVGSQMNVFSQQIGGQELVGEVKEIASPIMDMIMNILKISFFLKPQKRISRGQYIIGSFSVIIII